MAGVVAGGDDGGPGGLAGQHIETDRRRGGGPIAEISADSVAGADRRHDFGKLPGEKTGIVADDQALPGLAGSPQVIGQALGAAGYIGKGKVLGNDGPPAVGAELDGGSH